MSEPIWSVSEPSPALLCAFCMVLPGRSQGAEAIAWTMINGHATCQRHYEFAMISVNFRTCLPEAQQWELDMLEGERRRAARG